MRSLEPSGLAAPRIPHEELRECLTARQTRLQPPDDNEAAGLFASLFADGPEVTEQRERRPVVRRRDGGKSSKVLRHHAHNLERRTVHSNTRA